MENITHEDTIPQTERAPSSPFSPKRPRTDCTVANNHCGKVLFDFPELLTFRRTTDSPSSKHTLQKNVVRVCTAESWDIQGEKPHEQPQDNKLIVRPVSALPDNVHTRLSEICFRAERHFLHLRKDEQPPLTETDKLSSYLLYETGGTLAESHTSNDASADTSSHHDSKRLGKSLEDEPPVVCCFPTGDDEDGRQVQNNVNQTQVFALSLNDEEVRCQSDCTYEDAVHDAGFCSTWSQPVSAPEDEASNQKKNKPGFCENILFTKEMEEGNSHISPSDYAVSKSFYSNSEEPGNLADCVRNEEKISEFKICEDENIADCDGETKGNVNQNGMSKNSVPTVTERSTVSYDVVLTRNIAAENESVVVDDFCGAEGKNTTGKMIAIAWSEMADHTTESPMPVKISQGSAEGDNDPGPFSVIDPAIWSETDRGAEEKRCNSESSAGVELSPSVKVCETGTPLALNSDVRLSHEVSSPGQTWQFNQQSPTQQYKDEKEDLCRSYTERQVCSFPIHGTHMTGNESSCQWKSSPSSSPHRPTKASSPGRGRHESHSSVRHELKEKDQSNCFPVSPNHLNTHVVKYSHSETEIQVKEDVTSFVEYIKTDEYLNLEKEKEPEENFLEPNGKHKENTNEISTREGISDWTSQCDNRLTETSEGREGKEVTHVGEEMKTDGRVKSEILVKTEDGLQQHNGHETDTAGVSRVRSVSEWTEVNTSKSENTLSQVSQHEQGDELLVFTIPPTSDAVVPCQHDFSHSQNINKNPTALKCNDRFSSVPSALAFYNRTPGGFDTFEKIHLSPDGDDDDDPAGLGNSPLLTSLPGQLLKTSEQQLSHSMPGAESDKHEEVPGEEDKEEEEEEGAEEVERLECHIENMVNEFLSSDSTCNDLPNFICEADTIALAWPEQQPHCESACDSCELVQDELKTQSVTSTVATESDSPSDVSGCPQFEMKKQFDIVLKELNLFFDISINEFSSDSRASTPEQGSDAAEMLVGGTSHCKEPLSSPELGHHRDASSDDADEDPGLEACGDGPVISCTAGSRGGEQEVPLGRHVCQETPESTAGKHREPQEMEQRKKIWSPSFMCPPFFGEVSRRPPEPPRRLEPLRTCTRPIRVGLSKRAKTKHLHRPHPYK